MFLLSSLIVCKVRLMSWLDVIIPLFHILLLWALWEKSFLDGDWFLFTTEWCNSIKLWRNFARGFRNLDPYNHYTPEEKICIIKTIDVSTTTTYKLVDRLHVLAMWTTQSQYLQLFLPHSVALCDLWSINHGVQISLNKLRSSTFSSLFICITKNSARICFPKYFLLIIKLRARLLCLSVDRKCAALRHCFLDRALCNCKYGWPRWGHAKFSLIWAVHFKLKKKQIFLFKNLQQYHISNGWSGLLFVLLAEDFFKKKKPKIKLSKRVTSF